MPRPTIPLACLLVVVATFVAFYPSLGNGFTNWDDEEYVTESTLVTGLSGDHLKRIFTEPVKANYHPLTILTLALDYRFWGLEPLGYHATNLALHLLNTLLVFFLVLRLADGRRWVALFTALFFGIHPMHVESVAWVSARKDVLYAFFFIAALIFYTRFVRERHRRDYWIVAGLFLLALLSKPMAVVLPPVLLAIDYWLGRKSFKAALVEKIPLFVMSVAFGIVAIQTQAHAMGDLTRYSAFQRIAFACYGLVAYLVKLFAPVGLSALHPYPRGQLPGAFLLAPVAVLGIALAILVSLRRTRLVAFGMLFFFLNLALVLQVVSVGQAVTSDRYSYLAYVGPLFVLGMLYATAMERGSAGLTICIFLCAAACMFLTLERCTVWKNSEILWTDVLDKHPGSHVAHYNRGMYYRSLADDGKALADFDRAIELKPNYSLAYNNRGGIRYRRGDLRSALADFDRAIESDPSLAMAHYNRGRVHMARQADDLAIRDYDRAVELQPDLAPAYNNRASIYFNRGNYRRAYDDFDRAVSLDPDNAAFLRNREHARDALGRSD